MTLGSERPPWILSQEHVAIASDTAQVLMDKGDYRVWCGVTVQRAPSSVVNDQEGPSQFSVNTLHVIYQFDRVDHPLLLKALCFLRYQDTSLLLAFLWSPLLTHLILLTAKYWSTPEKSTLFPSVLTASMWSYPNSSCKYCSHTDDSDIYLFQPWPHPELQAHFQLPNLMLVHLMGISGLTHPGQNSHLLPPN